MFMIFLIFLSNEFQHYDTHQDLLHKPHPLISVSFFIE